MSRYGLNLNRNRKSSKKKPILIIAFLCFTLLLGACSTFLLWRSLDYDFNNFFKNSETTTAAVTEPETEPQRTFTGEYAFAALVTSDDKSAVYCAQLICVDLESKTVRVVPVDVLSDFSGQSFAAFAKGASGDEIKRALSNRYSIEVNRYLILTETKYKSVFRILGDITLNVPDDVAYDADNMFLELPRGENVLSSEKVHKYMRYISETFDGKTAAHRHAEICSAAFEAFFTSANYADADNLFARLVNCFDSDITIVDYTNSKEQLGSLVPQSPKEHLKVYVSETVREIANEE